jgi:hypothetical protein
MDIAEFRKVCEEQTEKERKRGSVSEKGGVLKHAHTHTHTHTHFTWNSSTHGTLTRTRKTSAAVRPSAAEKEGSEVSPGYDTTQHAHAHNKPNAVEKELFFEYNATRHEAITRVTSSSLRRLSSKFSALGTPAKTNCDVQRNALLWS